MIRKSPNIASLSFLKRLQVCLESDSEEEKSVYFFLNNNQLVFFPFQDGLIKKELIPITKAYIQYMLSKGRNHPRYLIRPKKSEAKNNNKKSKTNFAAIKIDK